MNFSPPWHYAEEGGGRLSGCDCWNLSSWLPIPGRIQHKLNTLCYQCIMCTAPSYLCDCLKLCTPSHTLRSASDTLSLQIPHTRLLTLGSHAFSHFCPSTWNDLPLPLQKKPSLDSFKSKLWTLLFSKTIDLPCSPLSCCCLPRPSVKKPLLTDLS